MKKVLLSVLAATLMLTITQPAQAEDQKVLAIIDSAIDSTKFNSIIQEVCFTTVKSSNPAENMSCPNGELFMEGKGSASAPWPTNINSGTYHGDTMVKSALVKNPNTKIVFIRVYNVSSIGASSTPWDGSTMLSAIDWVNKNASRYSIDAVSISQAGINIATNSWHIGCTDPSIFNPFVSKVAELNAKNIPTFVATGNDGLKTIVGFPACVTGVIGVGASTSTVDAGTVVGETATNRGPGLDMIAPGRVKITKYNGSSTDTAGSSVATVLSASSYVNKNTFKTFTEYLNALPKQTIKFVDSFITVNKIKTTVWEPARVITSNLP